MDNYGFITLGSLADCGRAVSDEIQKIIDDNPNRTIYFPDGTYILDKPVVTPADPEKSVDLQLSNYAVLKASDAWTGGAMVSLGGKEPKNDTHTNGSNYTFSGGIVDGSGVADGISIDGGRETAVRRVSMKNVRIGLNIAFGANSGSSDSDITDVNIIGTGGTDSIGVVIRGYDNTLTNMRIGNVFRGIMVYSSGNVLRNLHPLYYSDYTDYENSCGFWDCGGNNWYDYCYSDQFGNGFITEGNVSSIFDKCFCFWYSNAGGMETVFRADGRFDSLVTNMRAGFRGEGKTVNTVLKAKEFGRGKIENLFANPDIINDKSYEKVFVGSII